MEKIKFNKNDIIFNVRMTRVKDDVIKLNQKKLFQTKLLQMDFQ